MKKVFFALVAALAVVACNKTPDPAVSVNPATVEVGYEGSAELLTVELKASRAWKLTVITKPGTA